MAVELVERPLPKPSDEGYIEARLLETLGEARLALEYLERGLTRNAACKAFQAWKALLAALLRLELERLKALAKTEEEKRWLESKAVPRVPTTKMKELGRLLEEAGHYGISAWTDKALDLHDYQYHGAGSRHGAVYIHDERVSRRRRPATPQRTRQTLRGA
jgi:hypothetical protein